MTRNCLDDVDVGEAIVVFWNPAAGTADAAGVVRDELQQTPGTVFCEPGSWPDMVAAVAAAADRGARMVVAAGGDGTVNGVVTGLMQGERRPPVGILPLGSGNDFSRTLNVPRDTAEAWQQILTARPRPVDIARVQTADHDGWQVNMLTGGNSGRYLENLTDEVKARWGPFCYLRGAFELVGELETYHIEVRTATKSHTYEAVNVFVANGTTSGGGLTVCKDARVDDGMLDLIIVRDGSTADFASLVKDYVFADFLKHPLIERVRVRAVEILATPAMPVTVDGESIGNGPVRIEMQPAALEFLHPQLAEAE